MINQPRKKRGFAALDSEQLRRIASAGGIARREAYKTARQHRAALTAPTAQAAPNEANARAPAAP